MNSEIVNEIALDLTDARVTAQMVWRWIFRDVRQYLTQSELVVLLFIYDRTYAFGKEFEEIPTKHFLDGIRSGDETIALPVGIKRAALYNALARLADNDIIIRRSKPGSSKVLYSINRIWRGPVQLDGHPLSSYMDTPVHPGGRITREIYNKGIKTPCARRRAQADVGVEMGNPKDALLAAVAASKVKSDASREKRKNKGGSLAYQKIWADAYQAAYGEKPFQWKVYEGSALDKAFKRAGSELDRRGFLEFVVTNWSQILGQHFKGLRLQVEYPEIGLVTKYIDRFAQAYKDHLNPNRKLENLIAKSGPKVKPKPKSSANEAELKKQIAQLQAENRKLKDASGEAALKRHEKARKLLTGRNTGDTEFGRWED